MPNGFPCPNPACPHVFPPESVKGAAALTCPDCGTTFQFRPSGRTGLKRPNPTALKPPAAPRPVPPPPPVAAVPVAAPPQPPAVPLAAPVTPTAPAPAEEPAEEIISRRRMRPRAGGSCGYAAATVLVGLVGVSLIAFVVYLVLFVKLNQPLSDLGDEGASGSAYDSKLFNYRFVFPPTPWKMDQETKLKLHTGIAMRRTKPNAWLAILAKDYKTRTPQEAELIDEAVRDLQSYFRDPPPEWQRQPDGELAGRPARHLEFVGEVNSVEMTGDCYALAANGIGYWFLSWAPTTEKDAIADELAGIRKNFTLLHERDGWTERQGKIATLRGKKLDYTLGYSAGLWEKQDDPAAYDPDADAALLGRDPTHPQDADKTATALVVLLPAQPDFKTAVAAARSHLLAQEKKLYPETTLEDADPKSGAGDRPPEEVGNTRGRVLKLRAKNSDALEHFIYLAVVRRPGHTLVLQCECDYRRRPYWEVNFTQLARRLALKQ